MPSSAIILFAVATVKWGVILDLTFNWTTGEGVVHDAACSGAFEEVTDVLPAEGDGGLIGVRRAETVGEVALGGLSRKADAR